jgi:hypothetical protein
MIHDPIEVTVGKRAEECGNPEHSQRINPPGLIPCQRG